MNENYLKIPLVWAQGMDGKKVDLIASGNGIQIFSYHIVNSGDCVTDMNAYDFFADDFTALEATGWNKVDNIVSLSPEEFTT